MVRFCFSLLLCLFCSLSAAVTSNEIRIETFRGAEINPYIHDVVKLCDMIYRECPYFYNGDDEDYTAYIESYAQSTDAIICLALDGNKAVGVVAGVPMTQTRDLYKQTLSDHAMDLNSCFYIGEVGLKAEYRGKGIENTMYQKIEDYVKQNGSFQIICLWELDRGIHHHSKEVIGYLPRDDFWLQHGFIRHPELHFNISWVNIHDTVESPHLAVYWLKRL